MKTNPIQLHAEPSRTDLLTRLCFSGEFLTQTPPPDFSGLVALLASWSGAPVELVLPADCSDGQWLDVWIDTFDGLPHADAKVRFVFAKSRSALTTLSAVEGQR